jgi:hypothetical protein
MGEAMGEAILARVVTGQPITLYSGIQIVLDIPFKLVDENEPIKSKPNSFS